MYEVDVLSGGIVPNQFNDKLSAGISDLLAKAIADTHSHDYWNTSRAQRVQITLIMRVKKIFNESEEIVVSKKEVFSIFIFKLVVFSTRKWTANSW